MPRILLPISKSIANRRLILQAIHGDGLMTVSACGVPDDARIVGCFDLPEDVQILHRALTTLHHSTQRYTTLNLSNCVNRLSKTPTDYTKGFLH